MTKPKEIGLAVVIGVILIAGGYAIGRYAAPDKVTFKERIVERTEDRTLLLASIDRLETEVATLRTALAVAKDVRTKRVVEKRADGTTTITTEIVDTTKINKTSDSTDSKVQQEKKLNIQIVEKLVYRERETLKIVERNRPNWSLALTPGLDVAGMLGHGSPVNLLPTSIPGLKRMILGASIERRVIGPLSAGVWANSAGMGGLVLRLEF